MTTHADAIKTLSRMMVHKQSMTLRPRPYDAEYHDEIAAIALAIDAMTVVEWVKTVVPPNIRRLGTDGITLVAYEITDDTEKAIQMRIVSRCEAPTLSELAAKLKEKT